MAPRSGPVVYCATGPTAQSARRTHRAMSVYKAVAFTALLFTQTSVALLFKLSQRGHRYTYSTGSAQTSAEALKLAISIVMFWRETVSKRPQRADGLFNTNLVAEVRSQLSTVLVLRLSGLAALYAVNNQLAFLLFKYADMATNALVKSGVSFVSAFMLWVAFGRKITPLQWKAIVLQVSGLVTMQYDSCNGAAALTWYAYALLGLGLCITAGCNVRSTVSLVHLCNRRHLLATHRVRRYGTNTC